MSEWRARAEFDVRTLSVKIAARQSLGDGVSQVLTWPTSLTMRGTEAAQELAENDYLRLDEGAARAIYEALADYFGGTGNDTRALRQDYDNERKRVDKFIAHLTREITV